jgi:small subunit ribosomal protein S4e
MMILLRNRLKYALTGREVQSIVLQKYIKVDGKVRTDPHFPTGYMDVIQIEKTNENFRLLYNSKGRYVVHCISPEEAKFKLCRVRTHVRGKQGIPYINTHDGRTIRFPHPDIHANYTVKVNIETGKVVDFIKFDVNNLVQVTGGANVGRVGIITRLEKHPGSFEIVHIKDAAGNSFSTRLSNVFVIGKGQTSLVSLPKDNGVRKSVIQEMEERLARK